jgi:hypothetical protein
MAGRNHRAGAAVLAHDDQAIGLRDQINHADCVELAVIREKTVDNHTRVGDARGLRPARSSGKENGERNNGVNPLLQANDGVHIK